MSNNDKSWIVSFIWGIADDVLRDIYVRGKYRDVILPMVVIRRLDAVLEPTKKAPEFGIVLALLGLTAALGQYYSIDSPNAIQSSFESSTTRI